MKRIFIITALIVISISGWSQNWGKLLQLPDFKSGKPVWIIRAGIGFNNVTGSAIDTQNSQWDKSKYDGNFKANVGYIFTVGFNKSFGNHPLYWGMELGLGVRGYKTHAVKDSRIEYDLGNMSGNHYIVNTSDETLTCYNAQILPFTIGYKYSFLERMAIDIHVGAYASYDFAGKDKIYTSKESHYSGTAGNNDKFEKKKNSIKISDMDHLHKYDAGLNIGIGYWFGRFNVDLTYQRGFIPLFKGGDEMVDIGGKGKKGDQREKGNFFSSNFQLRLGYAF